MAIAVGALVGSVWLLANGMQAALPSDGPLDPTGPPSVASITAGPHLVFQNVIRGEDYAKVSVVPLSAPDGPRLATGLVCERLHFAGGQGLCLAAEHGVDSTYHAVPFGRDFLPREPIPLDGSPNLAQVSADGRYGAASVITAQATEQTAAKSQALLIDMVGGTALADLSEFSVSRDGAEFMAPDFEFWGVTFSRSDSDRFYATLLTSGNTYLVEGNVASRTMSVVHQNVSAPSLSPEGTRIAYAKLMTNIGPTWRFYVLDLATMVETTLAETTSIDDQMEWLDDAHVLYGLSTDVWSVPADGSGAPELFLDDGLSPAVVR